MGAATLARGAGLQAFLATGHDTYIADSAGKRLWEYPTGSRDGWVLPNGNILLAINRTKDGYGGGVVEVTREGKEVFRFDGSQDEVNTVQPLEGGRLLLTEAGDRPRILEIDRTGKVLFELAIPCQTENHHMQTRMTRKIANGNYLVPQMGEMEVVEYTPKGEAVWRAKTPGWPFQVMRLDNGNTFISCTRAHEAREVDPAGKVVWRISNEDFDEPIIVDSCGAQRLSNGNTVFTSYGAKDDQVKLFEVTPAKEIVWTYRDGKPFGIHTFQVLAQGGKALPGRPWK
ncbi:MAG: hypothetical protein KDC27_02030 [Acidobacteria bacterium]|nr:hypothetical protein [Acidobacteriota bacterium]